MEEDLDPSSVLPESPEAFFRHAFGISSLLSLFFAVLFILTYGRNSGFIRIRFLFLLSISTVHLLSLLQPFLKGLPRARLSRTFSSFRPLSDDPFPVHCGRLDADPLDPELK
jgi:hypothetical protein